MRQPAQQRVRLGGVWGPGVEAEDAADATHQAARTMAGLT
jgi:hypothetical protein